MYDPILTFDYKDNQIDNRLCCAVSFCDKYEYFALLDSVTYKAFRIGRCELGNSIGELCSFSTEALKTFLDNKEKYIDSLTPQGLIRDLYGDYKNTCNPMSHMAYNPSQEPNTNLLLTFYYADYLNIGVSFREKGVKECDKKTLKDLDDYKSVLQDIKELTDSCNTIKSVLENVLSQPRKKSFADINFPLGLRDSGFNIIAKKNNRTIKPSNKEIPIITWYIPENLTDLINYTIFHYIKNNIHFKKCVYCNRYFALTDGYKSEYCKRNIEDLGFGKTCRSHGKSLMYGKRINDDPLRKAYTRSYRTHNARVRLGIMTKYEFEVWAKQAQEMRDKCIQGFISLQELKDWLNKDKLRNTAD